MRRIKKYKIVRRANDEKTNSIVTSVAVDLKFTTIITTYIKKKFYCSIMENEFTGLYNKVLKKKKRELIPGQVSFFLLAN